MRRRHAGLAAGAAALALLAAACGSDDEATTVTTTVTAAGSDACADLSRYGEWPFVIVTGPLPGDEVSSGFTVTGCSRTFESNVPWTLVDGFDNVIAQGNTTGGGVDGPGAFETTVDYTVDERQIAELRVVEDDPDEGGRSPVSNVIPVILTP